MQTKPHHIFAFFSLLIGLFLVFIIPVAENADEMQHLRRVSEVSQGMFIHHESETDDKFSLWADSAWLLRFNNVVGNKEWHFTDIKNIKTEKPERTQLGDVAKNAYALNSPVLYIPFAAVLKITDSLFNLEYWQKFYVLRIASLLISVVLLATAIAKIPEHKNLLAALCLLPTMFYTRSGINVDGIVIGCAFHFLISVYNLCLSNQRIKISQIAWLIFWAFLLAQGKGAYIPLLLAVFLIPKDLFLSKKHLVFAMFSVIVPAVIIGLGWSGYAKNLVLKDLHYKTIVGDAWPDGQVEWMVSQPIAFAEVMLRTVFTTPLVPQAIIDAIGFMGWNLAPLPPAMLVLFAGLISAMVLYEPVSKPILAVKAKLFLLVLACASVVFALSMLYVQWTGYKQPIIEGFQGRYLYPLLPIFVLFATPHSQMVSAQRSNFILWFFGALSSVVTLYYAWNIYSFVTITN